MIGEQAIRERVAGGMWGLSNAEARDLLDALAAAREREKGLREALEPWANEPCWTPLVDGEVYDAEEHGELSADSLTPCGGCPPCRFRAALAREDGDG